MRKDHALALGLNTYDGKLTYAAVAEAFPEMPAVTLESVLA
jgi:alanine dehydrogenase